MAVLSMLYITRLCIRNTKTEVIGKRLLKLKYLLPPLSHTQTYFIDQSAVGEGFPISCMF